MGLAALESCVGLGFKEELRTSGSSPYVSIPLVVARFPGRSLALGVKGVARQEERLHTARRASRSSKGRPQVLWLCEFLWLVMLHRADFELGNDAAAAAEAVGICAPRCRHVPRPVPRRGPNPCSAEHCCGLWCELWCELW